jgi:hypothetical protein
MGPDPAIHKVIDRPDIEGTPESPKRALYVLKLLVMQDHLLGGKASVCGLEDELSID